MNDDATTATFVASSEAEALRTLIAQAAGGGSEDRTALVAGISRAQNWRDYYAAVPGAELGALDTALTQARAATGQSGSGGIFQKGGLKLGRLVIPWVGVAAGALFLAVAFGIRRGRRRGRRAA